MRAPRLITLLVTSAFATIAGCGGADEQAGKPRTSAQPQTATSAGTATGTTSAATRTVRHGHSDPAPGRAVQVYFEALSRRDGDTACRYIGEGMKRAALRYVDRVLKDSSIKTCGAAHEKVIGRATPAGLRKIRNVEILSSTVEGSFATVKVKGAGRDAQLTKIGGRWLITGGIF